MSHIKVFKGDSVGKGKISGKLDLVIGHAKDRHSGCKNKEVMACVGLLDEKPRPDKLTHTISSVRN